MRFRNNLPLAALGIYALARLVSIDLLLVAVRELRSVRMLAGPAFRLWHNVLVRWDAAFYVSIARAGYPATLPTDAAGAVVANNWAFFPLFPLLAGAIGRVTGLPFEMASVAVNIGAGGIAAVLLAQLVRTFSDDRTALRAVAVWSSLPAAFILHVPYAEATYLALASACLFALVTRRDATAAVLLVASAFSRGYVLPLSAAALGRLAFDYYDRRQSGSSALHRNSNSRALILTAAALAAPFLWMAVAAVVTGRFDAYTATQRAWGYSVDWSATFRLWRNAYAYWGPGLFVTTPVVTLAAVLALTVAGWRLRLPRTLQIYSTVAAAFLLLLAQPGAVAYGSLPRFAFGILTLPIIVAIIVSNRWVLGALLIACTGLQYLWILNIWSGRLGVAP